MSRIACFNQLHNDFEREAARDGFQSNGILDDNHRFQIFQLFDSSGNKWKDRPRPLNYQLAQFYLHDNAPRKRGPLFDICESVLESLGNSVRVCPDDPCKERKEAPGGGA